MTFDIRCSLIVFRVLMCIEALKCRMLNVEVLPKPAACRLKLPPDDPGVGTYLVVEPSDAEQQGEYPPTDHPEAMSAAQLQGKMAENHAGGAQGENGCVVRGVDAAGKATDDIT